MALELIKISEFPEVESPSDWIVVSDSTGTAYKLSKDNLKAFLGTVTVTAPRPIAPTDPAPTLDGVYIPTTNGVYANAGGLTVNTAEGGEDYGNKVEFIKNGAVWVKSSYPLPIQDISDLATKSELNTKISNQDINTVGNIIDRSYIQLGKFISSTGQVQDVSTADSIVNHPISQNDLEIGGFNPSSLKYFVYCRADNTPISSTAINLPSLPFKLPTRPSDATSFSCTIRRLGDSVESYNDLYLKKVGDVISVSEIKGNPIQSRSLSVDNIVPDPISGDNSINKRYFDGNAIKNTDLEISISENLAVLEGNIFNDMLISSDGSKSASTGWKMLRVDISSVADGEFISLGNFIIQGGGYAAFYNESDTVRVGSVLGYFNSTVSAQKPTGAKYLYIDISRPTGTNEYSQTQVNEGGELLPYSEPVQEITSIKGYKIGGNSDVKNFQDLGNVPQLTGNSKKSFRVSEDELSLEIFDPLEQNGSGSLTALTIQAITLNLPEGAGSPPVGVEIGDAWIDTSLEGSIKVRRV